MVRYATRVARSQLRPGRSIAYCLGAGQPTTASASASSHRTRSFCYTRPVIVHTVGHSTRALADFLALLAAHGIAGIADVRRFPASRRHPQFGREALARALAAVDVHYAWFPELGGRRTPRADSPHVAWREPGFRGYADHMETAEF